MSNHDPNSTKSSEVWVVVNEHHPAISVATVPVADRWTHIFRDVELEQTFDVKKVTLRELPQLASEHQGSVWLADGSFAIETLAVETIWEQSASCPSNELQLFAGPTGGLAPLACAGAEVLPRIAALLDPAGYGSLVDVLSRLEPAEGMQVTSKTFEKFFWRQVLDDQAARAAEWGLLKRLRMRPGGLVAQFLNRPVSILATRLVANTRVTPNQTTIAAFIIGLIGVGFVFAGQHWAAVLGTFLLHVNSILDGCDGELAIIKHQRSEFGGFLDSICDEILNALILVAIGYYLRETRGWGWYLYLGGFAGFMSLFYALVHWHCKWKHGLGFYWWWDAYRPRKKVQREMNAYYYLKNLAVKDSTLLLYFILAIIDFLQPVVFIGAAVGAVAVVLFVIHIGVLRARW
jgi:phosphatidylglycerophosphate synthase